MSSHSRRLTAGAAVAAGAVAISLVPPDAPWSPAAGGPTAAHAGVLTSQAAGAPNIVMITADDMTISDLAHMPRTRRLLVAPGTVVNGVAPTPICVPARASMLTGQYTHNHRAYTIQGTGGGFKAFADRNTLPVWLRRAGYATMFTGKYLNGYGRNAPRYVPPGWSSWAGSVDPSTYRYNGTTFNHNGRLVKPVGYSTDLIARFSSRMITRHRDRSPGRPFFLWANYVAPHHGGGVESDDPQRMYPNNPGLWLKTPKPAARHRNDFAGTPLHRAPEMLRDTTGSRWATNTPVTRARRRVLRELHAQRLESLQAVDEAVARTVGTLRREGILDRTLIVFTSDNGYLVGHHNQTGKLVPYHRSLRIPVVVRGPGIPRGARVATPVTNPDLAVSIAAAGRAVPGRKVDGIDMFRRLASHPRSRRVIPIEAYPPTGGTTPIYTGITYGAWTYVRHRNGFEELYDRRKSTAELANVARSRPTMLARLRDANRRYRSCAGTTCPKTLDPATL